MAMEGFGQALSARLPHDGLTGWMDGIGGAALLAALGLLLAWAFGAAALNVPGPGERDLRHALQSSRILTGLNRAFPPSGPLLNVLRHIDPTPAVSGPNANVRAPEPAIAHDPDVNRAGDQRGEAPRHRVRARHRGLRMGRRPRPRGDQRARGGRRGRHHGEPALGRDARRLGGALRPAQRSGDPPRGRAGPAGADTRAAGGQRHRWAPSWAIRRTGHSRSPRRASEAPGG